MSDETIFDANKARENAKKFTENKIGNILNCIQSASNEGLRKYVTTTDDDQVLFEIKDYFKKLGFSVDWEANRQYTTHTIIISW